MNKFFSQEYRNKKCIHQIARWVKAISNIQHLVFQNGRPDSISVTSFVTVNIQTNSYHFFNVLKNCAPKLFRIFNVRLNLSFPNNSFYIQLLIHHLLSISYWIDHDTLAYVCTLCISTYVYREPAMTSSFYKATLWDNTGIYWRSLRTYRSVFLH